MSFLRIAFWGIAFAATPLQAKQTYELVTLTDGDQAPGAGLYNSDYPAISSNGRFVTFRSGATNLVSQPTSGYHIFLRDRETGTTELISASSAGVQGDGSSGDYSDVTDDGCLVVFESYAKNLVGDDTNNAPDIFLRNRCVEPKSTIRISKLDDGSQTSWGNYHPDITPDGHYVVYGNGNLGAVRYDVTTGETLLLSGDKKTGSNPSISDDGTRVAFYSYWPLIQDDTNGVWDIYLWDAAQGLSLVSVSSDGTQREQGNESSSRVIEPSISGDGKFVSFATTAKNLVNPKTNGLQQVFVKNLTTGDITVESRTVAGDLGNGDSPVQQGGRPALSGAGYLLAFESAADNLKGIGVSGNRTILRNPYVPETGAVDTAGRFGHGARPAISDDKYGRFTAFFSSNSLDSRYDSSGVFVYDRHKLPVAVATVESPPIQPINTGVEVTLDGSGSHTDANYFAPESAPPLTYQWSQKSGPAVTLTSATAAKPRFTPQEDGSYVFELVVDDTVEPSEPALVKVDVGGNHAPIANAGSDQAANTGDPVTLNGSQSSDLDDDDSLTYSWTQLFGESVNFDNPGIVNPSFTPSTAGTYIFQLVVNDGRVNSLPSFVTVNVTDAASVPNGLVADAGKNVAKGSVLKPYRLDGRRSYDTSPRNKRGLTYEWSIVSVPNSVYSGSPAIPSLLRADTSRPTLVPPLPGEYVLGLTVGKNGGFSETSLVSLQVGGSITVTSPKANDIWSLGDSKPATIQWINDGIPSGKKYFSFLVSSSAPCAEGCIVKPSYKAGSSKKPKFKLKLQNPALWNLDPDGNLIPVPAPADLSGQEALLVVCLYPLPTNDPNVTNDPVCGVSGVFGIQ
jgi:hypothetical protein